MEEKINQALVQLEKDLQSLVSARKQVDATIKASSELQIVVSDYVSSVKKLCVGLKAWEDNLSSIESSLGQDTEASISKIKKICDEITSSFASKADNINTLFQNGTKETLDKYEEQNSILAGRVGELTSLREQIKKSTVEIDSVKGSLEVILKELNESQEEQDKALEEIRKIVSALPTNIQQNVNNVIQVVNRLEQVLNELLGQTNMKIDDVSGKTDTITSKLISMTDLCHNINSSINSSTTHLSSTINNAKEEITKSLNINRWIIIGGIIIIAILQFVVR